MADRDPFDGLRGSPPLWNALRIAAQCDIAKPNGRLLLVALAGFGDRSTGANIRPSIATLAAVTGMSKRSVSRLVADLIAVGAIEQTSPARQHHAGVSTRFRGGQAAVLLLWWFALTVAGVSYPRLWCSR